MKKIEAAQELFARNEGVFQCPNCGKCLRVNGNALCCCGGHSFDLSAKGYVNLAPGGSAFYGSALFAARQRMFAHGFFRLLYEGLAELAAGRAGVWLDAGCGEGSGLRCAGNDASLRIGLDMAKDGIRLASSGAVGNFAWIVGDLTRLPLVDGTVDVLLNVLSPANYAEFGRVLRDGGLVLKVIPGPRYLYELREAFFGGAAEAAGDTAAAFANAYPAAARVVPLTYEIEANAVLLADLLDMTPLTRNVSRADKDAFLARGACKVTCDFVILANM